MSEPDDFELLLVEDNTFDAAMIIRLLKQRNPSVTLHGVKDCQQAVDFLVAEGSYANRVDLKPPRLILLDIRMRR